MVAVAYTDSETEFDRHWRLLMRIIGHSKLYRCKLPTAPREVWAKRQNLVSWRIGRQCGAKLADAKMER